METDDDSLKKARSYVLYLLSRRDYSRTQLEKKLAQKKYKSELARSLIDSLISDGTFREAAYQKARTRQLLKKGLGASLVKSRLRFESCAIQDTDIETAYEHIGSSAEIELRALVQKQLRRFEKTPAASDREMTQKITKALQLKGHRFADISRILKEELAKQEIVK